ncbi:hypothetical protein [Gracilibacillus suaedae]|uniref:hypothetical protein n=1 Tax=Gracilibacillus suaedae TaxID=2820273 RepID=UPI001ABDFB90|nr:hypothetical protein [Gracilibacillus suaedae]
MLGSHFNGIGDGDATLLRNRFTFKTPDMNILIDSVISLFSSTSEDAILLSDYHLVYIV